MSVRRRVDNVLLRSGKTLTIGTLITACLAMVLIDHVSRAHTAGTVAFALIGGFAVLVAYHHEKLLEARHEKREDA